MRRVPCSCMLSFSCFAHPYSFSRCQGRRFTFSCFTCPDLFSAFPRASSPVFIFFAQGLISHGTEGVGSHFHVLRTHTLFRRCRGRRFPFSYFTRPDSFPTVPRASGPVFKFCAPRLVFDGTAGIASCFHVLRALTRFRRYRGRRLPFSCFAVPTRF
jgi:hypothetical protein